MDLATRRAPDGWVPVEHRVVGLDRRSFLPGLVTLAVALVLIYGLPALNAAIPWDNEVRAGDVLDLGAGATAVPPPGWQLEDGTLTGGAAASPTSLRVVLVRGGSTIVLTGAAFTGGAAAFLDQVQRSEDDDTPGVDGPRGTVITASGLVGVVQGRGGPGGDGLDAAFKVAAGTPAEIDAAPALLVRVKAPPGQFEQVRDEVAALLRSITPGAGR
ncbi:hypothetical protein [Actinokineospora cianjurensis]|uniref:Uncharacterized protein n=1 Tax=Actinokineospora cianjurensis TaxID=585224 RepID=A0A421BAJ5_9PSEU|nr:hypothetical protein [Actinokineospora cianjurensis]RLK61461.1 hypothetical protein CLV68_2001 [Actinokineospora cianjurensis]